MQNRCGRVARSAVVLCLTFLFVPATGLATIGSGWIENRGQLDPSVLYHGTSGSTDFYFTRTAIMLDLADQRHAVMMRILNGSSAMSIEATGERGRRFNFFLGNDPARWRSGVPAFDEVLYREVWEGIDLRLRPDEEGLRYELLARPGADRSRAAIRFEGIDRRVELPGGRVRIDVA